MKPLTEKEERNLRAVLDMWENMEEEQRLMQLRFMLEQAKREQAKEFEKMLDKLEDYCREHKFSGGILMIKELLKEVQGEGK